MVRVHSGLPFQVAAAFSTCDSLPVYLIFPAPAAPPGEALTVICGGKGWSVVVLCRRRFCRAARG
jgi:hypothetical protein